MLPPTDRTPLPADGVYHWRRRYFDVGDTITWCNAGLEGKHSDIVTRIKVNRMGRVSYFVKSGRFVIIEDVARAHRGIGSLP